MAALLLALIIGAPCLGLLAHGGANVTTLAGRPGTQAVLGTTSISAPAPVLRPTTRARVVVAPKGPALSWPVDGESAIGVAGIGLMAQSPRRDPVPIASLTKLMTAYVILEDHPLQPGRPGPSLQMTGWSVLDWRRVVAADGSNVEVRVGEVLTERQLLEALLLPSADNVADVLGAWDAGSDHTFVAKMNAAARSLGLSDTSYADDSGLSPRSRSDAADQETLAAELMANPVVRAIVDHRRLPFPVVGTIRNVNPALGVDGIVGLKSGYTSKARGCLAVAAYRSVGGHRALVLTVTLGQPKQLVGAAKADEALLTEATRRLEAVRITAPNERVATLSLPWSPTGVAALAPAAAATVVGWPGLELTELAVPASAASLERAARAGVDAGPDGSPGATAGIAARPPVQVGTLEVSAGAAPLAAIPLVAAAGIPPMPRELTPTAATAG